MTPKAIFLNADLTSIATDLQTVQPEQKTSLPPNPFVGLRPYTSEEGVLFFGRHKQIIELLQQLHRTHFLTVVGSSGCGKSSLIRAGLIPKLKAGFLVEDRDHWKLAIMKPGESPLNNLSKRLLESVSEPSSPNAIANLAHELMISGVEAITRVLKTPLCRAQANLLLVVDQFEELFRYDQSLREAEPKVGIDQPDAKSPEKQRQDMAERESQRNEAARFVSILVELAIQTELPVYIVITMRSDFLGDCDVFRGLPEKINETIYLVPRLDRQQRQEVIENPIKLYGRSITPRLLDLVVNDVGDESDQLPVMQHALMRTWERWKEKQAPAEPIDTSDYEAVGMISDALAKDANRALGKLTKDERLMAERMFQALVGIDVQGRKIRRPVHLSQLARIAEVSPEQILDIVNHFRREGRCFLTLSTDEPGTDDIVTSNEAAGDPLIDISHESFIRQWTELRKWVKAENNSREIYTDLAAAAQRYFARKRGLYTDTELQVAQEWWDTRKPNEAWSLRYNHEFQAAADFLKLSKEEHEKEQQEQRQRALEELENETIRQQNQKLTRQMHALLIISVVAFLFLGATAFSFVSARRSERTALREGAKALEESKKARDASLQLATKAEELTNSLTEAQRARDEAARLTILATTEKDRADQQAKLAGEQAVKANQARRDAQQAAALARSESQRASGEALLAIIKAADAYKAREELRKEKEDKIKELNDERVQVITKLGSLYQKALLSAGNPDTLQEAVKTYEEIFDIYEKEQVRGGMLSTLLVLGRLFDGSFGKPQPERALAYYTRALTFFETSDRTETPRRILTLLKMGDLLYGETGSNEAAKRYEEAIGLGYQETADDPKDVYLKLADFYGSLSSHDDRLKAVPYYERQLALIEQMIKGRPKERNRLDDALESKFDTLVKLGTLYTRLGQSNKAKDTYDQAMALASDPLLEKSPTEALVKIGISLNGPDERQLRKNYYDAAASSPNDTDESRAAAYARVGNLLYTEGQYQDAKTYLEQAETFYGQKESRSRANTLQKLGIVYEKLQMKDSAVNSYRRALAIFEDLKATSLVALLKRRIQRLVGDD